MTACTRISLALVTLIAAHAMVLADTIVPDAPDLMLKTRVTYGPPGRGSVVIRLLYLQGARARREAREPPVAPTPVPRRPGTYATVSFRMDPQITITQCDERQMVVLNPETKIYALVPIHEEPRPSGPTHGAGAGTPARQLRDDQPTGGTVTITVDAVDTGERRPFSHYTARHVITTTKTESSPGASMPAGTSTVDGWYLDVPDEGCADPAAQRMAAPRVLMVRAGNAYDRIEFRHLGNARSGYPIEETTRVEGSPERTHSSCELIALSEAPLDAALFTVPADYLPALPGIYGGFDLSKPDTIVNRLGQYWYNATSWARYLLHRSGYGDAYEE